MKLTRRQETFFRNLLDLTRELQGPIHYSVLAERVGVSRITAYDMLRLLEDKGLVTSDYQRAEGKSGPGRAEVVFWPTEFARRRMSELAQETNAEDWETVKERLLEQMQTGQVSDQRGYELAQTILALLPPDGPKSLRYCVEVMTVITLRLHPEKGRKLLLEHLPVVLPETVPVTAADLNLLSGFALGLLVKGSTHRPDWDCELFDHVKQYCNLVAGMNAKTQQQLANSIKQALNSLAVAN